MAVDAFDPDDFAIRCPPDLTPDHFAASAAFEREIGRRDRSRASSRGVSMCSSFGRRRG